MLTYDNIENLRFNLPMEQEQCKWARQVLAKGKLIKAKSSFLALKVTEVIPGTAYKVWGKSPEQFSQKYSHYHFTPDKNLFIVSEPTWCECPEHLKMLIKNYTWLKEHLGYASLIFLYGETLYEAITSVQRNSGLGQKLLKFTTESFLLEHPELVFIPLVESAKL